MSNLQLIVFEGMLTHMSDGTVGGFRSNTNFPENGYGELRLEKVFERHGPAHGLIELVRRSSNPPTSTSNARLAADIMRELLMLPAENENSPLATANFPQDGYPDTELVLVFERHGVIHGLSETFRREETSGGSAGSAESVVGMMRDLRILQPAESNPPTFAAE